MPLLQNAKLLKYEWLGKTFSINVLNMTLAENLVNNQYIEKPPHISQAISRAIEICLNVSLYISYGGPWLSHSSPWLSHCSSWLSFGSPWLSQGICDILMVPFQLTHQFWGMDDWGTFHVEIRGKVKSGIFSAESGRFVGIRLVFRNPAGFGWICSILPLPPLLLLVYQIQNKKFSTKSLA